MGGESRQPIVEVRGVTKRYPAQSLDTPDVLRDLSLTVHTGDALAIVGPSGSGKSTLLNLIGTLDHPTRGQVIIDGDDVSQMDERRLAVYRGHHVGFIFQDHHLLPQCSAIENVLVPTLAHRSLRKEGDPALRAQALLERAGLSDHLHQRPGQLSGGQCQRVAVVRALINKPKLLLADEPTGALDRKSAVALGDLLIELNQSEGVTLIVVTHSDALAERLGRVLHMRDGLLEPVR
jgi:lipoprotein-releasing system ATP-binding protein